MRLKYNDAYSKLYLFFNKSMLNNQWNELDRHITYCRSIVFKLVESTTQDEFIEWYTTYFEAIKIVKQKMKALSKNIIDAKIDEMIL